MSEELDPSTLAAVERSREAARLLAEEPVETAEAEVTSELISFEEQLKHAEERERILQQQNAFLLNSTSGLIHRLAGAFVAGGAMPIQGIGQFHDNEVLRINAGLEAAKQG